ncbi:MAG: hypothetical protein JOZ18_20170, partial [Chloroflexi bacterium]|nr:hypothetical protein [Chloroflexota bacterium]
VPQLYIVDGTYHRVIDLKIIQSAEVSVTMQVVQQYVSNSLLAVVNAVAADPQQPRLYFLTQKGQNATAFNLTSIDVSQNACAA